MLTIRQQQIEILGRVPLACFQNELAGHFFRFYPHECERAGEGQVLKLVQMGIERAAAHGYRGRREVGLYINQMICLGCDFDRDPQFPWAARLVDDASVPNALSRMNRLHQATVDYLRKTGGDKNGHLVKALVRMRDFDLTGAPAPGPTLEQQLGDLLTRFYPEKVTLQSAEILRALLREGIARAAALGIPGGAGPTVVTTLMFMLGSGFDHDPLYPWAARALDPANSKSAPETALYRASMDYLALALLDG